MASKKQNTTTSEVSTLSRDLKSVPSPYVIMVVVKPSEYINTVLEITTLLSENSSGVYLTLNRPYTRLSTLLTQNNVDCSKIKFVDAITAVALPQVKSTHECDYIKGPSDLTEINIRIPENLKKIKGKKFLIVDSVSTLLMYNKGETIVRFLHSLSTTLSALGTDAVFIALEGEDTKGRAEVFSQFCDKIIEVK